MAEENAPAQEHHIEVYADVASGSCRWRCSCGKASQVDLSQRLAEHAARLHQRITAQYQTSMDGAR